MHSSDQTKPQCVPRPGRLKTNYRYCILNIDIDFFSGSCPEFGVSGSGIVREWKKRLSDIGEEITGPAIDDIDKKELQYQYSFVGPLSMSKGCDLTADFSGNRKLEESQSQSRQNSLENRIPEFVYRGKS